MSSLLQGVNLYLIGMMGAGKTTVGHLLAQELGYGFLDTDNVIAQAAKKSINEIFAEAGEAGFRQIESDVLAQVCSYTKLTVATGGGIVLRRENWSYLHHGLIVWLDVSVDILYARLAADTTRPLLQDDDPKGKLRSLLEQRTPLYSQADLRICVNAEETPEQIANKIMQVIPSVLKQTTAN
ncbi:shikimate kinase [Trichormus variabilis ATCC 29413]|uniref:Shikimate kinase n=2 Tax=Anabaena variabilis TaxID=264691 RepID=AROK_TRIV2|nr:MULTISPECIES: shikimate kinase [Nostocaceae]Q3MFQ9.1 RecName: Full=Shikimate kinase; Short=SK [Trichormus variabilis ATCC 29413]ABA20177.1 shikimate kinase [Trichormus variabilis ATCC 29413]MBC1215280.1 shikimate kinase [Trichormus variabilis ARAD]MBC1255760.1 shikimate kinase [Trichormus variabilis V5]MBC1269445.1 shikimate kinase [Trichormus variabilis FSR]MBC1303995.1 shikimate kinase [Trichormus variabilis N2B]